MRILYLHGLGSSKLANTPKTLQTLLKEDEVASIDIPMSPFKAVQAISAFVDIYRPDLLLGTSLGGFYASLCKAPRRVITNPALRPDLEIKAILGGFGTYPYLKEREDGAKTYDYTVEDEREFKILREKALTEFYPHIKEETYAFFGDRDDLVNDRAYFEEHFLGCNAFSFPTGHRLEDEVIVSDLAPFLSCLKIRGFEDELSKRGDRPLREFMREFLDIHGQ